MGEIKPSEVSAILRQQLAGFTDKSELEETGVILEVGDGIARVYGLTNAQSGELIYFDSADIQGIVLNLEDDNVGIVLLGDPKSLNEGDICRRTRRIASIKVNENMLGRVINTLGEPIDGKGPIEGETYELPLERKAPGVIFRQPVKEPLQTGIKAIDAMIPIGRGQRELIIGDRQIGKTAIAIDTIINQNLACSFSIFVKFAEDLSKGRAKTAGRRPCGFRDYDHAVMFFLICRMAFFSRRETCACDTPTALATSICVRPS